LALSAVTPVHTGERAGQQAMPDWGGHGTQKLLGHWGDPFTQARSTVWTEPLLKVKVKFVTARPQRPQWLALVCRSTH